MTSRQDNQKRWRPKFSVRTLVVVVTLACCYAACWGPTKTNGVQDVVNFAVSTEVAKQKSAPQFMGNLYVSVQQPSPAVPLMVPVDFRNEPRRRYYFWFFGYVAKLPYELEITPPR